MTTVEFIQSLQLPIIKLHLAGFQHEDIAAAYGLSLKIVDEHVKNMLQE